MLGANVKNKYIALLSSTALIFFAAEASAQSAPPAIYVTPARTLTNGQTTPLFTDVNGNLKITGTLTGFASTPTFNCGTGCYQSTQPVSQGAGSVVSGAYLSGSFADGAIATLGTQADAAWTSGNGTGISLLKAMATSLSGIAAGTAASSTLPIYGQATTIAPTYANNSPNPLSLDTAGNLRVNVVTGGGGGGAVYGPTAVGTAAANPPVLAAGTANATATGAVQVEKVDSSGNQYVVLSTGANAIGSIINTSFAATQATASSLNATVVGTGTFATQVTSLPALVAGTANIGVVGQAQGSTTSGQNGQLIQGAVTTATPTYTTAQTNPLSLDTNGGLRVQPAGVTPAASTASTITTGGTAVTAVTGPVRGCYITNPTSATDEGIGTAENLYVNPVTTATSVGNGTTLTLVPGQTFFCLPGQTTNVSVVAATTAHKFTAVQW